MKITVVLADDHRIVREGLAAMMNAKPDIEVVAQAKNGREALRLVKELSPQVVVMDVAMPDLNGVEATRQISQEVPQAKILALSMHSDMQFISKMLAAGASGYVLKDSAFEELANAIRAVSNGRTYLSAGISDMVLQEYVHMLGNKQEDETCPLSTREREVLQLLAEGMSTKDVANRLHLSAKTVESHRRQIMEKLNVRNIAGLTKYAVRQGLTSVDP
jgi:DNA-binding NarL/FixJ family response regulator